MKKLLLVLVLLLIPMQSWAFTVYFKDGKTLDNCYSINRFTPEVYGYDGDNALAKDGHVIRGDEAKVVGKDGKVYDFYWDTIDVKPTKDSIREEWQSLSIKHLELVQKAHEARLNNLDEEVKGINSEIYSVEGEMSSLRSEIDGIQRSLGDVQNGLDNVNGYSGQ
ncbi:MAG: hypothetical protein ACYDFU_02210 [Nitrospirota bacterium]